MSEHEVWNELGNLYSLSGSYNQAIMAYKRAIALTPEAGEPCHNLGQVLMQVGRIAEAAEFYQKSGSLLHDQRQKATTLHRLGDAQLRLKEYALAMEAYQRADDLIPEIRQLIEASPPYDLLFHAGSANSPSSPSPIEPVAETPTSASGMDLLPFIEELTPWWFDGQTLPEEKPEDDFDLWPLDEPGIADPGGSIIFTEPLKWDLTVVGPDLAEPSSSVETTETPLIMNENLTGLLEMVSASTTAETSENVAQPVVMEAREASAAVMGIEPELIPVMAITEPSSSVETAETPLIMNENLTSLLEMVSASTTAETAENVAQPVVMEAREASAAVMGIEPELTPVMVITDTPEVTTETPEFVEQTLTNPEAIQYEAPGVELPMVELSAEDRAGIQADIEKIKRTLEINPRNPVAWDTLGGNYKALGQYEDAIHAYRKAVALDSSKAFYFHHLGLVFAAVGEYEDAIGAFERVLEIDPNHSLAHATLGGYYRKNGKEELAQAHITKARSLLATDENEYNRACMEAICGNTDQALELLEVALKNKQTYVNWARKDPDLDFIRNDPRFEALIADYVQRPAQ